MFRFRRIVVNLYFVHGNVLTKKLLVSLENAQTLLRNIVVRLFLVDGKWVRHPFWKKFSHGQKFMQNCENTAFRHIHDVSDLLQLHFEIFQDDFVSFLDISRCNPLVRPFRAFGIFEARTTALSLCTHFWKFRHSGVFEWFLNLFSAPSFAFDSFVNSYSAKDFLFSVNSISINVYVPCSNFCLNCSQRHLILLGGRYVGADFKFHAKCHEYSTHDTL